MKFKTKEALIEEFKNMFGEHYNKLTHTDGIRNAFKSFAERINFYDKYYSDYDRFIDDYPDVAKDNFEDLDKPEFDRLYNIKDFNQWLSGYCFGDVTDA